MSIRWTVCCVTVVLAACGPPKDSAPPASTARDSTPAAVVHGAFPRTGVAVRDTVGDWCAEFVIDSSVAPLKNGDAIAIVFPGGSTLASLSARVAGPHSGQCHAEFAQPRWFGYSAYRLELVARPAEGTEMPMVALAVASNARWTRGADGVARADLDGDGTPEEARRCTADEGEHLSIWSVIPKNARARRWHEYYDWGGFTDPTCKPGEKGEGTAE